MYRIEIIDDHPVAEFASGSHPFDFDRFSPDASAVLRVHGGAGPAPLLDGAAYRGWEGALRSAGADERCLENLAALEHGTASCIVTGQQAGFLGGPHFTLLKALCAVHLSRELTVDGRTLVPVFWVVSEDHDVDEANAIGVFDKDFQHHQLRARVPPDDAHRHIFQYPTDDSIEEVLQQLSTVTARAPALPDLQRESRRLGGTYGAHFLRWLLATTRGTGLVPFLTHLPEIKAALRPFARKVVTKSSDLVRAANNAGARLESQGKHRQIVKDADEAAFFLNDGHHRHKVRAEGSGFRIDDRSVSLDELLDWIDGEPTRFSANVLSNPPMMRAALPVVGMILGAGELAYHQQLPEVYRLLDVPHPTQIPRGGVTILTPEQAATYSEHDLSLSILRGGEDSAVRHGLLRRSKATDADVWKRFQQRHEDLWNEIATFAEDHGATDLDRQFGAATQKSRNQIDWIQKKVEKRIRQRHDQEVTQLRELQRAAFPGGVPQERHIAAAYFLHVYGPGYVAALGDAGLPRVGRHAVVTLRQDDGR